MAKVTTKRIGLFIPSNDIKFANGQGSFLQVVSKICDRYSWDLDVFTDHDSPFSDIECQPYIKTIKADWHAYEGTQRELESRMPGLCFNPDQMFAYQTVFSKSKHEYDVIFVERPENYVAVMNMNVAAKVVYYSHGITAIWDENSTNYDRLCDRLMTMPGVIVGTHTKHNETLLKKRLGVEIAVLPLPLIDENVDAKVKDKDGVLFIGRFDDNKDPFTFIEQVKAAGQKPVIITPKVCERDWKELLSKHSINNAKLHLGVGGQEKMKIISSAHVAFLPSKQESFHIAALEALHSCPVVTLKRKWAANFVEFNIIECELKDVPESLNKRETQADLDARLILLKAYEANAYTNWKRFVQ